MWKGAALHSTSVNALVLWAVTPSNLPASVQATIEDVLPVPGQGAHGSSFTVTLNSPANLWGAPPAPGDSQGSCSSLLHLCTFWEKPQYVSAIPDAVPAQPFGRVPLQGWRPCLTARPPWPTSTTRWPSRATSPPAATRRPPTWCRGPRSRRRRAGRFSASFSHPVASQVVACFWGERTQCGQMHGASFSDCRSCYIRLPLPSLDLPLTIEPVLSC